MSQGGAHHSCGIYEIGALIGLIYVHKITNGNALHTLVDLREQHLGRRLGRQGRSRATCESWLSWETIRASSSQNRLNTNQIRAPLNAEIGRMTAEQMNTQLSQLDRVGSVVAARGVSKRRSQSLATATHQGSLVRCHGAGSVGSEPLLRRN